MAAGTEGRSQAGSHASAQLPPCFPKKHRLGNSSLRKSTDLLVSHSTQAHTATEASRSPARRSAGPRPAPTAPALNWAPSVRRAREAAWPREDAGPGRLLGRGLCTCSSQPSPSPSQPQPLAARPSPSQPSPSPSQSAPAPAQPHPAAGPRRVPGGRQQGCAGGCGGSSPAPLQAGSRASSQASPAVGKRRQLLGALSWGGTVAGDGSHASCALC